MRFRLTLAAYGPLTAGKSGTPLHDGFTMQVSEAAVSNLLYCDAGRRQLVPLAVSTLVGRHWGCGVRLGDPGVPLYWLEIRWLDGVWGWRALGAEERTRGTGSALAAGWRQLAVAGPRQGRVRLSADVWVELVEAGPPRPHLVDLQAGSTLDEAATAEWVELRADLVLPLDAEGDASHALPDGTVLAREGRAVRVHAPAGIVATMTATLDLARGRVFVDIDSAARKAVLTGDDGGAVTVRGECVRVLEVYRSARRDDVPRGGWLSAQDALAGYVALGGAEDTALARMSWERCRLRSLLSQAGVANVSALFEVAPGRDARVRLGFTPEG